MLLGPRAVAKQSSTPEFREDLRYWVQTDRSVALRVFDLIEAVVRKPFIGIGKPEPLNTHNRFAFRRNGRKI